MQIILFYSMLCYMLCTVLYYILRIHYTAVYNMLHSTVLYVLYSYLNTLEYIKLYYTFILYEINL